MSESSANYTYWHIHQMSESLANVAFNYPMNCQSLPRQSCYMCVRLLMGDILECLYYIHLPYISRILPSIGRFLRSFLYCASIPVKSALFLNPWNATLILHLKILFPPAKHWPHKKETHQGFPCKPSSMRLSSPGWQCLVLRLTVLSLRQAATSPKFSGTFGVWLSPKKPHHPSLSTALVTYPTTYCLHAVGTCIQSLKGLTPQYVTELWQPYTRCTPRCNLRSSTNKTLVVPKIRTITYGIRLSHISLAAPQAWNNLPADLRNTSVPVRWPNG